MLIFCCNEKTKNFFNKYCLLLFFPACRARACYSFNSYYRTEMASCKKQIILNATAFCDRTGQRFQTILGEFVDRLIVHFHLSARVDGSTKAISIPRRNSSKKGMATFGYGGVAGIGSKGSRMCGRGEEEV